MVFGRETEASAISPTSQFVTDPRGTQRDTPSMKITETDSSFSKPPSKCISVTHTPQALESPSHRDAAIISGVLDEQIIVLAAATSLDERNRCVLILEELLVLIVVDTVMLDVVNHSVCNRYRRVVSIRRGFSTQPVSMLMRHVSVLEFQSFSFMSRSSVMTRSSSGTGRVSLNHPGMTRKLAWATS